MRSIVTILTLVLGLGAAACASDPSLDDINAPPTDQWRETVEPCASGVVHAEIVVETRGTSSWLELRALGADLFNPLDELEVRVADFADPDRLIFYFQGPAAEFRATRSGIDGRIAAAVTMAAFCVDTDRGGFYDVQATYPQPNGY